MVGPSPIPAPKSDDDEDVSWALSTASALWGRGESSEALKWLRRAAETASDANRDMRAVELFKAAAELANDVDRSKSVAPPPDPTASTPPPAVASADAQRPSAGPMGPAEAKGGPTETLLSPSRRPPPPPRRAGSLPGPSELPPPGGAAGAVAVPAPSAVPHDLGARIPAMPTRATIPPQSPSQPPTRPGSPEGRVAPPSPSYAPPPPAAQGSPPSAHPHAQSAGAQLVSPMGGRNIQNLPQRKQPVIVPPVVAGANAALRRASMPSVPAVDPKITSAPAERASAASSTSRDSAHDDPPTKQMTPQQAASLSRRARTASRTKGLLSLAHGGAQQKERTRTRTERGERQIAEAGGAAAGAPEPPPSAAKTLKRAVAEATEEMPAMALADRSEPTPRPRREDEITVVRPPFPKPDPKRAAELASLGGSFDDEQTNVLAGDEPFVDFRSTDSHSAAPAVVDPEGQAPRSTRSEALKAAGGSSVGERVHGRDTPAAANTEPSRVDTASAATTLWSAFRVSIVADPSGLRVAPAKEGAPAAFLVPADAASADAIARMLEAMR